MEEVDTFCEYLDEWFVGWNSFGYYPTRFASDYRGLIQQYSDQDVILVSPSELMRYRRAAKVARRRGLEWDLDPCFYSALTEDGNFCTYCEEDLTGNGVRLDRIDSMYGYTEYNVAPCCRSCNVKKGSKPLKQFAHEQGLNLPI